jgi:hypothetical protein
VVHIVTTRLQKQQPRGAQKLLDSKSTITDFAKNNNPQWHCAVLVVVVVVVVVVKISEGFLEGP